MKETRLYTKLTKKITVEKNMSAPHAGSRTVDVYATPIMTALVGNTTTACLNRFLEGGEINIDVMVWTTHGVATSVDIAATVEVEITAVDHKEVSFHIMARDERDLIGTVDHDRFVVKKETFEAKALSKLKNS